jgi:soluble lytic murein transglycosylase
VPPRGTPTTARRRPRRPSAAARRRRAALLGVVGLAAIAVVVALVSPLFHHAVREISLPLRHEDIIRQQAEDKRVDPALIAAVIYAESRFRDQTSHAGAKGLMQILPSTARFIARRSGGTAFRESDLADPQVNIAYGSWYLRYLLDRYGGSEPLALAAYNGGETNLDRWLARSARRDRAFTANDIPFSETRAYVDRVLRLQERYRDEWGDALGV